jgi:hypothetical protein
MATGFATTDKCKGIFLGDTLQITYRSKVRGARQRSSELSSIELPPNTFTLKRVKVKYNTIKDY